MEKSYHQTTFLIFYNLQLFVHYSEYEQFLSKLHPNAHKYLDGQLDSADMNEIAKSEDIGNLTSALLDFPTEELKRYTQQI